MINLYLLVLLFGAQFEKSREFPVTSNQGTHCTGKIGKMAKKFCVRENTGNLEILPKHRENTGNLEILPKKQGKTQGIWFAQVLNSLILKVKDISIFAAKIPNLILKLDKSAKSVLCM